MKNIESRIKNVISEAINEKKVEENKKLVFEGKIKKVGDKWRIEGKGGKLWKAHYDSKADAQAGLKAYFANESKIPVLKKKLEEAKKRLKEYIEMDEVGPRDTVGSSMLQTGDERLEREINDIDSSTSPATKFIDVIRTQALKAMSALSNEHTSDEFQLINNIFNLCQKYDVAKKKKEEEGVKP